MKKVTFLFLSCLMALSMNAESLKGKWKFEAPGAPYGFHEGTIEFKNVNEATHAVVDFGYTSYEIKDVKETEKDVYTTKIPINGEEIDIVLDNSKGDMKTSVTIACMNMTIKVKMQKAND